MKKRLTWNVVHESDDDEGNPTLWATKIRDDAKFVWIELTVEHAYGITHLSNGNDYLHISKSLTGAKRWVSEHLASILSMCKE